MPEKLTCDAVEERGLVERYLARQLSFEDEEALEGHYLTCARCQQRIRFGAGLRASLSEPRPLGLWRGRLWAGVGLAAAAGIAALVVLRPGPPSRGLAALGVALEPPVYLGVQVRAPRSGADSLFEAAIAAYVERRYTAAARGLQAALAAGTDSLSGEFFLASSRLMEGQPARAIEAFDRVLAIGETPYLDEARFYRAKGLLQLGRAGDALQELRLVAGALSDHARALADSVEEAIRR